MKNIFYTVFSISLCLLLGKGIYTFVDVLPASLYGMLLYCLLLQLSWLDENKVAKANDWLIKNMGIFFVPAGVGIIDHIGLIQNYGVSLIAIIFFTTFSLLTLVGLIAEKFIDVEPFCHDDLTDKRSNKAQNKNQNKRQSKALNKMGNK